MKELEQGQHKSLAV